VRLHSPGSGATLVWDIHDVIYLYGPLDQFRDALKESLREADAAGPPNPHSTCIMRNTMTWNKRFSDILMATHSIDVELTVNNVSAPLRLTVFHLCGSLIEWLVHYHAYEITTAKAVSDKRHRLPSAQRPRQ